MLWRLLSDVVLVIKGFIVQASLSPVWTHIFSLPYNCQDFLYQHIMNSSVAKAIVDNLIYFTTALQNNRIMGLSRAYHLESSKYLNCMYCICDVSSYTKLLPHLISFLYPENACKKISNNLLRVIVFRCIYFNYDCRYMTWTMTNQRKLEQ